MSWNVKQLGNMKPYAGETVHSSGCFCGMTADICEVDINDVADWATANGWATNGWGTKWGAFPYALRHYGHDGQQLNYDPLTGKYKDAVFDKWKASVQSGYCGGLCMGVGKSNYWTNSGHYIAVVGYDSEKDMYKVADPASYARDGWHTFDVGAESLLNNIKIAYTTNVYMDEMPQKSYAYRFEMEYLKVGSQGKKVKLMQKIWKAFGWYKGRIDGDYAGETQKGCIIAQKFGNIKQDGDCGYDTQRVTFKLFSTKDKDKYYFYCKPIVYGSNGDSVVLAQCLLATDRFYRGTIDGDAGDLTRDAIIKFQLAKRATGEYKGAIDGKIEELTWKALIGF